MRIRSFPIIGISLFVLLLVASLLSGCATDQKAAAEKAGPPPSLQTEQEVAEEKFLSNLERSLASKFFDYRKRPVVRVAVFDFTDGTGNVVKAGATWADKIARRLYSQPQFEVLSHERVNQYLSWNSLGTVGKLDTAGLRLLQRRINTMDPGNGIHALITGEVKKGTGRSLQLQAYLVNFESQIGEMELEKNLIDVLPVGGEIPLPTEQAVQEATEVLVRGEKQAFTEGRFLILANTRGYPLVETEYLKELTKEQAFAWNKIPSVLIVGREEYTMPKQVQIGAGRVTLTPIDLPLQSSKRMEHSFLHGKFATNEVYLDEMIPPMKYQLNASFIDLKNNQTYSETVEVEVFSGTTTIVVLSFFVPSEKERIRSGIPPHIKIYPAYGKGLEILPRG
jgi:hypothetical protein